MNTELATLTANDIPAYLSDDERIELPNGWYATVRIEYDDSMGEPWKEHDGHGEVSEWTTRDKRPGERILHSDRGSHRYYDFAGAVELARKDGWGCSHVTTMDELHAHNGHATAREMAACAAQQDFDRLRAWCNDQWQWIGVIVAVYDAGGEKVADDSLWGIESDGDYWRTVAAENINTIIEGLIVPSHVAVGVAS